MYPQESLSASVHSLSQELMQMICAWKELLSILPHWLRQEVDKFNDRMLQELRLRINEPPELVCGSAVRWLTQKVTKEDLHYCINAASRYSPWNALSMAKGYLTAPGGHRIGICGEAVSSGGHMTGIREVTSLCIRVSRDFPGIAENIPLSGSVLILGAPGWGKTTLLRDLIRRISDCGEHISVVDERQELFPGCFHSGPRTDVLSGISKESGIDSVLRSMGPAWIAVDEITAQEDCAALLRAGWCGVRLLATAHAASYQDFVTRPIYRPLAQSNLFENVLVLRPDKSWRIRRVNE